MSRIDELIEEHCPAGVKYMTLAELFGKIPRGKRLTKSSLATNGLIPVFHGGLEPIGFHDQANSPGRTVMIINTGASSGTVGWSEVDFWCSDGCFALPHSEKLVARFLYYYTAANQKHFVGRVRRAGIPTLAAEAVLSMSVPVPPLEVQSAIVEILDTFSKMEAELEAELEARKQQYEHYRDAAIRQSESQSDWLTLYEVAEYFGRGKSKHRPRNDPSLYGGPYPFIQTGDVRGSSHRIISYSQTYNEKGLQQSQLWPVGTICITIAANIAETGILQFEACFPDSIIGMIVDPKIAVPGYVEYLLRSRKESLVSKGQGSAQANINLATFKEVRFPFPSLEEQKRIVDLLDNFDALVNDLSVGLPAELAARRQQYEYYRDKLLTFKELEPAS